MKFRKQKQLCVLSAGDLPQRMRHALDELGRATVALNTQFLATGEQVSRLAGSGHHLVEQCKRLVEIASGGDAGVLPLTRGMELVQDPLVFLTAYQTQSGELLARLERDLAAIDECLTAEWKLRRAMAPLRTVRVLFRVVAAPLDGEVQVVFSALMNELGDLYDRVQDQFQSRFAELRGLREKLVGMIGSMRQDQERCRLLALQRSETEATLRHLSDQLHHTTRRQTQIESNSQLVASAIDAVVTGLQWQDILYQKQQHIAAAVNAIILSMQETPPVPRQLWEASRLEAAQLRELRRELGEAEQAVVSGVGNVRTTLRDSDASSLLMEEIDCATTASNGLVQTLLDIIASLDGHIKAALDTTESSLRTIQGISLMASDLTSLVRDVTDRTQLLGINAQIQASKVSDEAGLGVLSARTSVISGEVTRISTTLAASLDEAVRDLALCGPLIEASHTSARERLASFRASRDEVEGKLHALRDEALSLVGSTGTTLDDIVATSESAASSSTFTATVEAEILAMVALLDELVERTAVAAGSARADNTLVTGARQQYSIASEHRVLAGLGIGAAAAGDAPASSDAAGVELFDMPSAPAAGGASPATSDEGSQIELFN